ncbi:MAG: hypothetical protein M1830_000853, partial [Pleopsidium flavum]
MGQNAARSGHNILESLTSSIIRAAGAPPDEGGLSSFGPTSFTAGFDVPESPSQDGISPRLCLLGLRNTKRSKGATASSTRVRVEARVPRRLPGLRLLSRGA